MKKYLLAFLILPFLAIPVAINQPMAYAQTPVNNDPVEVTVEGADEPIPLGEIVVLNAVIKNAPPNSEIQYQWKILDGYETKTRVRTFDDNVSIMFGAGIKNKTYLGVLSTSILINGDKPKLISPPLLTFEIQCGDDEPEPEPTPVPPNPPVPPTPPTPVPPPVFPDDKFTLAKRAYEWAQLVEPAARAKGAPALAGAFAQSAAAAPAIAFNDLLELSKTSNSEALKAAGVDPKAWEPFFVKLQDCLFDELYDKGLLNAASDRAIAFSAISTGLKGVK